MVNVFSYFPLCVLTLYFNRANRQWTRPLTVCAVALALHVISGVAFYIPNLGSTWNLWY